MFNLGYVLGVLVGDGNLNRYKSHYSIGLETVDKEFAQKFKDSLESLIGKQAWMWEGKLRQRNWTVNGKLYSFSYRGITVKAHTKRYFYYLREIVKDLRDGSLPFNDSRFVCGFIKGFYDSDGSLSTDVYPNRTCYDLRISNTNLSLLDMVQKMLKDLGIKTTLREYSGTAPFLQTQDSNIIDRFIQLTGDEKK